LDVHPGTAQWCGMATMTPTIHVGNLRFVRFNSKGSCTDKASPAPYVHRAPFPTINRMMSLLLYLEYAIRLDHDIVG